MYAIGQKFDGTYPPDAAVWCNENGAMIVQVAGGFEIQTPPEPVVDSRAEAQAALNKSDLVALRCFKNGVPFPAEWATYCAALRAIVVSGVGPLPVQPAYPEGS